MNTNNLYEKVNQTENQINYEELYGKNEKKNNPEQIFNARFNEGINILRQPLQSKSALEKNQIFNSDNNYDSNKNYYNRYQNNIANQSLMNCEEGSGVGNFAVFKSDPSSNDFINSLTNQNQQQMHSQQISRQQMPSQQMSRQQQMQSQQQMPSQQMPRPQQQMLSQQQQMPRQQQQMPKQQNSDYFDRYMPNDR